MKKRLPRFDLNLVGLALIVIGYLWCLGWVLSRSVQEGELAHLNENGKQIVTVMHWQLEPGFREALQVVIDQFNALPHVQAANVEVRQLDVPQRVYETLLNVHAVSGTSPDLCQLSLAMIRKGSNIAQYFTPLSSLADQPNPYNDANRLPGDWDPSDKAAFARLPWRETLQDGMLRGWVAPLQDYFAVPTSFQGQIKMFYNRALMQEAKAYVSTALAQESPADWLDALLFDGEIGGASGDEGFLSETPELHTWLRGDGPPQTLGQLFLIGGGIRQLGASRGDDTLVPIAGNIESTELFAKQYLVPFTSVYTARLDLTGDATVVGRETWLTLDAGLWSFDDPPVRAYFECLHALTGLFPAGFLGLDREQARRRFINGQSAMLLSGVWDAANLYRATEGRLVTESEPALSHETVRIVEGETRADHRFSMGVFDFPLLPGPGERWSALTGYPANEAKSRGDTAFMVYRDSPRRAWATEFLQFFTSVSVNERFAADAGLLPIAIGAKPMASLQTFVPDATGLTPGGSIGPSRAGAGQLRTIYDGQLKNFLAGDIDYGTLSQRLVEAVKDPRAGAHRLWYELDLIQIDRVRDAEAILGNEAARAVILGASDAESRYRRNLRLSVLYHNGTRARRQWHTWFERKPFPDY